MAKYRLLSFPRMPGVIAVLDTERHMTITEPQPGEDHFAWREYQDWLKAGNTPDPVEG